MPFFKMYSTFLCLLLRSEDMFSDYPRIYRFLFLRWSVMSMMAGNMNSQLIFIFENERPLFAPDLAVFSLGKKFSFLALILT